ncbi:MAG: HlyD family type I secretion periplasmic adaptor subunit [Gammaproteobacteria bacterium]|nr:MAG: HlyD family type I secretion periplasmic adaptor subunit [Gammaproteobacteria bacterium]
MGDPAIEFLPAALEIQERPPSPLGRLVLWTLLLLVVCALCWSILGRVDIVTVAPGRVIPGGHARKVQAPTLGVVRALRVREGQPVTQGQLLVVLDPTEDDAELHRLRILHARAAARVERLDALLERVRRGTPEKRVGIPTADGRERRLLESEWQARQHRLRALQREIESTRAERAAVQEEIAKREELLPLLEQRLRGYEAMAKSGYAARNRWLELKQQWIGMRHDLAVYRERRKKLDAAIEAARARWEAARVEFEEEVLKRRLDAETRMKALAQEMAKVRAKRRRQRLRAPVDGIVQELAVHTLGAVVSPGQVLMKIVPGTGDVEVEAWIRNQDIGFVHAGQRVRVKVETYPYIRYGLLEGRLVGVSADAISDERRGLRYSARIRLDRNALRVDGRPAPLRPGMRVTAEILTGKRRLIEYLLDPIEVAFGESFRER